MSPMGPNISTEMYRPPRQNIMPPLYNTVNYSVVRIMYRDIYNGYTRNTKKLHTSSNNIKHYSHEVS